MIDFVCVFLFYVTLIQNKWHDKCRNNFWIETLESQNRNQICTSVSALLSLHSNEKSIIYIRYTEEILDISSQSSSITVLNTCSIHNVTTRWQQKFNCLENHHLFHGTFTHLVMGYKHTYNIHMLAMMIIV